MRVGRYVMLERLGAGGMGVVHAAQDPDLDRRVAVKLMHDASWSARLVREGQALARVADPNVVAVYDVGDHDGHVFIAMELVAGTTLRAWLAARPRTWREIVGVFVQAGRGLGAVHRAGFVHRDVKPDNILVGDDGRTRITDFGLARLGDDAGAAPAADAAVTETTRTGGIAGTPAYMAPEQLDGTAVDARADQFAFCVALFEALFGTRPFAGDTVADLRASIAAAPVRRSAAVPASLMRAVVRGLAERPADRFPSMELLIAAIDRKPARGRWIAIGAAAIAIAAAVLVWSRSAPADEPCRGAGAKLAATWNASRKAAIHAAFAAIARPYAEDAWRGVERTIDDYARDWIAMHEDTCLATTVRGEQPPEVLDLRMQCLAERRAELEASVGLFAKPDAAIVERAVRIAAGLSPLASCADVASLRASMPVSPDPRIRAEVAAQAEVLAAIRVLEGADRFAEARPQIERAVERAVAIGYPPAEAEARLLAGGIMRRDGDLPAAERQLQAAVLAAEAGRADVAKADALSGLVTLYTTWPRLADAHVAADLAGATIARLGGGGRAGARLERAIGDIFEREGKFAEARPHYQAALDVYRRVHEDFEIATTLEDLGAVEGELDRNADAEAHYREARDILVRLVGGGHGHVATILAELAESLRRQNKSAEAKQMLESGLAIADAAHAQPEAIAQFLDALGSLALDANRPADALPYVDRAYRLLADANPKRTVLLNAVRLQGESLLALHRYDDAIAKFEHAKRLTVAKKGPNSLDVAYPEEAIAAALEGKGDHAGAVAALERSLALRAQAPADDPELATTQFALARSLWPTGARQRARALAEQAHAGFVAAKQTANADDAAAWLKSHAL